MERKHKIIIIMNARPSFTKPDRDSFIQYFKSVLFYFELIHIENNWYV